ncbi:aminotransferase class V-fold PLP-dependent enzyme [Bythopirellula goksoeyrii]|uniref:Cysteine desulfurase n=1 Tax=Bythopirellula goksoeyrii TaxID=1400387 RepID=A0A5B9QUM7_9BACT|nr:cysteine desulfurase [Bythopirellula goksoeyrii]QEG37771.1 putative cysteine desulfurase [Bythopirellula goksoeyrii]
MNSLETIDQSAMLPESLRADFPILSGDIINGHPLVFLDNAASTQRPRQVIDAIARVYERDYANVHRGIHTLSERSTEQYEEAREKVARFIGTANPQEVIFTQGTTGSINLVARSWGETNLRPGDEILTTVMEHHSNLVPWQQVTAKTGATLRHVPMTEDGQLDMEAFGELLNEQTKLVAVTSMSNTLGTVNPIAEIIAQAHAVGALVLVDAAQSVPHLPTDVAAWDCDFLAFSGHKMLGPSGVGILYGKEALLDAMPPFLGGGSMINEVCLDGFTPAELPAKFEAGTPPIVPAIAMSAAIDYLSAIGLEEIHRHEQALVKYAYEGLSQIDGLRILGPAPEYRSSLVSFAFEKIHAHEFAQVLNDQFGVAVRAGHHCTQPLHKLLGISASTRASFYLYNRPEEVDRLLEGITAVQKMFAPRGRKRRAQ